MKSTLHYKKELSLLLGILVAGIILVLFFVTGGLPATREVSETGNLLIEDTSTIKLIAEKTSFLLSNIL